MTEREKSEAEKGYFGKAGFSSAQGNHFKVLVALYDSSS